MQKDKSNAIFSARTKKLMKMLEKDNNTSEADEKYSPISKEQKNIIDNMQNILNEKTYDLWNTDSEDQPSPLNMSEDSYKPSSPLSCFSLSCSDLENQPQPPSDLPCCKPSTSLPSSLLYSGDNHKLISPNKETIPVKKIKRVYDRKNCCPFCIKLVTNFTRHIMAHHGLEAEVIEYNKILDPDLKERKRKRELISRQMRNRGNYLYNQNVINKETGIVLPNRRPKCGTSVTDYAVCVQCCGTYKRDLLYRHLKKCPSKPQTSGLYDVQHTHKRARALKSSSILLVKENEETTQALKSKIFPIFKNDAIANTAMKDPLICAYGELMLSNHKEHHLRTYITSKMRDLARLFLNIQEQIPAVTSFELAFDPIYFDAFIKAVRNVSGYDESTGEVKIPSMPQRLCTAIKDSVDILMRRSIQSNILTTASKEKIKTKLLDFKSILVHSWKFDISTNAEKSRKRKKMLKSDVMPLSSDIKALCEEILKRELEIAQQFEKDKSYGMFEELCKITIAHIIVFNRRRAGEVARAPLENYFTSQYDTQEIPEEIFEVMNEDEKEAIKSLYCFHIPGKRGRKVPILLRHQMKKNLDTIFSCRNFVGIPVENKYLFPKLEGEPYHCGTKILRDLRSEFSLKNPHHLTSTGLRHHVATMSQVAGKNNAFVNALSHFLGHTPGTHKSNYMLPQLALEKGKVGLNLLQLAEGRLSSRERDIHQSKPDESTTITINETKNQGSEITASDQMSQMNPDLDSESNSSSCSFEEIQERRRRQKNKSKKVIVRKRWNQKEKDELFKHFSKYIIEGKDPGASVINEIKRQSGILSMRTWKQINTFINNHHKKKLPLPNDLQRKRQLYLSKK